MASADNLSPGYSGTPAGGAASEPFSSTGEPLRHSLTREQLDHKVTEAQKKLADLKAAQEELERERAALEEARRRRIELETGREEMLEHLTRGVGLLEEAEFKARSDGERMAQTIADLRESLLKIKAIQESSWKPENWQTELTRALASIENGRMEWNRARLKWPLLTPAPDPSPHDKPQKNQAGGGLHERPLLELCKIGLALTWPLALAALVCIGLLIAFLRR